MGVQSYRSYASRVASQGCAGHPRQGFLVDIYVWDWFKELVPARAFKMLFLLGPSRCCSCEGLKDVVPARTFKMLFLLGP